MMLHASWLRYRLIGPLSYVLLILLFNGFQNEGFHQIQILPARSKLRDCLVLWFFTESARVQLSVKDLLLHALLFGLDPVCGLANFDTELFLCHRLTHLRGP